MVKPPFSLGFPSGFPRGLPRHPGLQRIPTLQDFRFVAHRGRDQRLGGF